MKNPINDMTQTIELFASEVEIQVSYSIWGKDSPATHDDPPEYAEFELIHVKLFGEDILPHLNAADIEYILVECRDNHVDVEAELKACAAEAKYDAMKEDQLLMGIKP
jgi:hypothetical protein